MSVKQHAPSTRQFNLHLADGSVDSVSIHVTGHAVPVVKSKGKPARLLPEFANVYVEDLPDGGKRLLQDPPAVLVAGPVPPGEWKGESSHFLGRDIVFSPESRNLGELNALLVSVQAMGWRVDDAVWLALGVDPASRNAREVEVGMISYVAPASRNAREVEVGMISYVAPGIGVATPWRSLRDGGSRVIYGNASSFDVLPAIAHLESSIRTTAAGDVEVIVQTPPVQRWRRMEDGSWIRSESTELLGVVREIPTASSHLQALGGLLGLVRSWGWTMNARLTEIADRFAPVAEVETAPALPKAESSTDGIDVIGL